MINNSILLQFLGEFKMVSKSMSKLLNTAETQRSQRKNTNALKATKGTVVFFWEKIQPSPLFENEK
jgi:hypothetical protein